MQALTFNQVTFNPVNINDNKVWIKSRDLAKALGYSKTTSLTNLYNNNKDEFSSDMTLVTKLMTKGFGGGNSKRPIRIFSLRGAHLIAMFAKTKIAKQFRKWVLDILEKRDAMKTTTDERTPLRYAVEKFVSVSGKHKTSDVWKMVHTAFNVEHTHEIPLSDLPRAVHYVHDLCHKIKDTAPTKPHDTLVHAHAWRNMGILAKAEQSTALRKLQGVVSSLQDELDRIQSLNGMIHDSFDQTCALTPPNTYDDSMLKVKRLKAHFTEKGYLK